MKCPTCIAEGRTSRVTPGFTSSTLMGWSPYYDEAGVYHSHDPNERRQSLSCSNGHRWTDVRVVPCPAAGCDFGKPTKETT